MGGQATGRRDGAGYWTFFLWGAAGGALAFVAVMVTISGLTTALELFRLFFGIGLSFEAYSHVYVTAFGLVGPIFALASLPATGDERPRGQGLPSMSDRAKRRGGHASVHSGDAVGTVVEWVVPRREPDAAARA